VTRPEAPPRPAASSFPRRTAPSTPPPEREFFISDCHLGLAGRPDERDREARLLRFLDRLEPGRDGLTIAGDLFDFWFTYDRAIPKGGFRVISRLDALRRAGMPVSFVGGNHDFWALPFLRDELGIEVSDGTLARPIQGRRFLIAHGDGLGSGDHGYKVLKRVLRHPLAIALYRLIHPDLGIRLATFTSHVSRGHQPALDPALADRVLKEVALPAFAAGHDVVVLGHLHLPTLREEQGKALVILGDWVEHFTYLRVEGGQLSLERFAD
jgi:UDP-2,3-diacylglucosamine hydrolase